MGIGVGKGLQEIGKKNRILLPSLLGSIVSFVFIAAVQAVCFLAEHTWLLILAVVAFLMERFLKRNRLRCQTNRIVKITAPTTISASFMSGLLQPEVGQVWWEKWAPPVFALSDLALPCGLD